MGSYFNPKAADMKLEDYDGGKLIPYQVVATVDGKEFVGMTYKQLMHGSTPARERSESSQATT